MPLTDPEKGGIIFGNVVGTFVGWMAAQKAEAAGTLKLIPFFERQKIYSLKPVLTMPAGKYVLATGLAGSAVFYSLAKIIYGPAPTEAAPAPVSKKGKH